MGWPMFYFPSSFHHSCVFTLFEVLVFASFFLALPYFPCYLLIPFDSNLLFNLLSKSTPDIQIFILSLQNGGSGLPASATSRLGGKWADGNSGEQGGGMAGRVSAHAHPDQWSADSHPSGTAGPGWHRATGHGEEWLVGNWKHVCVREYVSKFSVRLT